MASQREGKGNVSQTQKKKIAAGKALGHSNKQIAEETGLSVKSVEHQAARPEVKALMRELADRFDGEIKTTYRIALDCLARNMKSGNAAVELEAVDRFIAILATTDKASGPAKGADQNGASAGTYTLAELYVSLERIHAVQR